MTTISKQDKVFLKRSGAYHSQLDETIVDTPGGFPLCAVKTKQKIPAKYLSRSSDADIIDEALTYFKCNVFFKNYDMSVAKADKLLVYLTLYISSLLLKVRRARLTRSSRRATSRTRRSSRTSARSRTSRCRARGRSALPGWSSRSRPPRRTPSGST